jgi:hypothetical protein
MNSEINEKKNTMFSKFSTCLRCFKIMRVSSLERPHSFLSLTQELKGSSRFRVYQDTDSVKSNLVNGGLLF